MTSKRIGLQPSAPTPTAKTKKKNKKGKSKKKSVLDGWGLDPPPYGGVVPYNHYKKIVLSTFHNASMDLYNSEYMVVYFPPLPT